MTVVRRPMRVCRLCGLAFGLPLDPSDVDECARCSGDAPSVIRDAQLSMFPSESARNLAVRAAHRAHVRRLRRRRRDV